ncbi:hypothetical protein O4U37_21800 [Escherichia coli]|uniref:hypothetical protein n=1 Tax=Escherichia coli TaxID=562 RepID=UPI0039C0ECDC
MNSFFQLVAAYKLVKKAVSFLMDAVAAVRYVKSGKRAEGKVEIFHVSSDKVTIDIS